MKYIKNFVPAHIVIKLILFIYEVFYFFTVYLLCFVLQGADCPCRLSEHQQTATNPCLSVGPLPAPTSVEIQEKPEW